MPKLHPNVLDKSLKGEHVLRHKHRICDEIWLDITIQT